VDRRRRPGHVGGDRPRDEGGRSRPWRELRLAGGWRAGPVKTVRPLVRRRELEGRACYTPSTGCSTAGKTMPVAVYSHDFGCAVTGGYVYRGTADPALVGGYLFGDYCSGFVWALAANGPSVQSPRLLLKSGHAISSFGQGDDGTLYLTDIGSGEL